VTGERKLKRLRYLSGHYHRLRLLNEDRTFEAKVFSAASASFRNGRDLRNLGIAMSFQMNRRVFFMA
jgi:hypothetical protein